MEETLVHGGDRRLACWVQGIVLTPPDSSYFLLPQFPVTVAVYLVASPVDQEVAQIRATLHLVGGDDQYQDVPMHPCPQQGDGRVLRGTMLPPTPGDYRYQVVLHTATTQVQVAQGELSIAAPRATEAWTQGPMLTAIDESLFLGNAAAAANPVVAGAGGKGLLEVNAIQAVLNATDDRDPSPALVGTGIEYVQVPFQDFSHHPLDEAKLWTAVHWIRERITQGTPVLVHCHAGIGRSGSVAVAYLLLFRYPEKTYDEVVAMVNGRLAPKRHYIYPHLGLPESVNRLRAAWATSGRGSRDYCTDEVGQVVAIAFDSLLLDGEGGRTQHAIGVGSHVEVQQGSQVRVRVTVHASGAPPRGVFVYTNLNRDGPTFEQREMRLVPGTPATYEADLIAERPGEDFWLTAFATPRRYDHDRTRTWLGGDLRVRVTVPATSATQA